MVICLLRKPPLSAILLQSLPIPQEASILLEPVLSTLPTSIISKRNSAPGRSGKIACVRSFPCLARFLFYHLRPQSACAPHPPIPVRIPYGSRDPYVVVLITVERKCPPTTAKRRERPPKFTFVVDEVEEEEEGDWENSPTLGDGGDVLLYP